MNMMENGKVENRVGEINSTTHLDSNLNSDKENMDDAVEFRLMMAYAQRRRPAKVNTPKENGSAAEQTLTQTSGMTENTEDELKKKKKKKKNKKKILKPLKNIFSCVQPQTAEPESPQDDDRNACMDRNFVPKDKENEHHAEDQDAMAEVADRVIGIADEFQFTSEMDPCIESDGEDDLEKAIGLLLREQGDELNKKFPLAHIATDLFLDYRFFERLLSTFLIRIGFRRPEADSLGPQAANRTQIAAALEITSRLASVEALPKVKLYKHGARYLQEYYSSWAQTQGGYEAVFPHEEEVD